MHPTIEATNALSGISIERIESANETQHVADKDASEQIFPISERNFSRASVDSCDAPIIKIVEDESKQDEDRFSIRSKTSLTRHISSSKKLRAKAS